ncbi:MAG: hypothetical protein JXR76_00510, partial [Deltaproteobacteria bacterium]|nr:hypothetical protein [Deltaproteobacteria bacterium]
PQDTAPQDTAPQDTAPQDTALDTMPMDTDVDTVPAGTLSCKPEYPQFSQEEDCKDENGAPIPDCMAECGAAYSWQGYECPDHLTCVDGPCSDTDGPSGLCYPPALLECTTSEDCACLPHICTEKIGWLCNENNRCVPVFSR